jgi:hypothetical protein
MSVDLYLQLQDKITQLDTFLNDLAVKGIEKANAERDYRVALRKEILKERQNGTPVSILSDVCRGEESIAELKLARDLAETMYDATKEACNGTKLVIRVLEEQIAREWQKA